MHVGVVICICDLNLGEWGLRLLLDAQFGPDGPWNCDCDQLGGCQAGLFGQYEY